MLGSMADVTQILTAIDRGDPRAPEELLPLVYEELRKLAAVRLANERPGQTLQPTALVHEAYLRLVGNEQPQKWNGRGHFFAAAADCMYRILVDAARAKAACKRGGAWQRIDLNNVELVTQSAPEDVLALDETLDKLARIDPQAAQFVKLRYFAGLSIDRAGEILGLSRSTAYERWTFVRAWLFKELKDQPYETDD
jgi:RNA polymerase sigma factor (TIGR02999 family)